MKIQINRLRSGLFGKHRGEIISSFKGTFPETKGYKVEDILDFLYSKIRRKGPEILYEQRFFSELPIHKNGSRRVYWAEEMEDLKGDRHAT